jgi:GAF domain-containing protein
VTLARDLMLEPVCLVWLPDRKNRNGFAVKCHALPEGQRDAPLDELFIDREDEEVQRFLRRNKSLKLDDASERERHPCFASLGKFGWKSMLAVPLAFNHQVLGILEVYSYQKKRNFTGWHQSLFESFAVQASMAIESLAGRQRLGEQNELMRDMAEIRDERELLKLLLERSLKLVGADRGWVSQLDPETGELNIVVGEPPNSRSLKIGKGITGIALEKEVPLRVGDVRTKEWDREGGYEKFWDDTRSELAVPIIIKRAEVRVGDAPAHASKPIGVLNIESPTVDAFSEEDANSLWLLAGHTAVAIEKLEV